MQLIKINNENIDKLTEKDELIICLVYDKKDALYYLSTSLLEKVKTCFITNIKVYEVEHDLINDNANLRRDMLLTEQLYSRIMMIKNKCILRFIPNFCRLENIKKIISKYI